MKGDFSKWKFDPLDNFNGVLHQQGRVLLDQDWNDQARIRLNWQDEAMQDVIGENTAAIPASEKENVKIQSAYVNADNQVQVDISPGQIWIDGKLVRVAQNQFDAAGLTTRIATYYKPPLQDPPFDISTINTKIRDAVVMEVWREAVNAFQLPNTLIEPALGGPDTTERIHTAWVLRLFRMGADDTCHTIVDKLKDDLSKKGKLNVSLEPPTTIPGDCPVHEEGGYTGFEHYLYRIEIAKTDSAASLFKWSQYNGGLVGRGLFDWTAGNENVVITANLQAILHSGLDEFYLEAVEYDKAIGQWKVTYGTTATLNSENGLDLSGSPVYGTIPSADNTVFFRLWNGIEKIEEYPKKSKPEELKDGIYLEFDSTSTSNYTAGDYWSFEVRAGEIKNPETLINNQYPEGIRYYRVPLAILHWDNERKVTFENGQITDCRKIFRPLINQNKCCTLNVGDGKCSFGHFDSIEEAIRHLPEKGGKICILPGHHHANAIIKSRKKIQISGCGERSLIRPRKGKEDQPIFKLISSQFIEIDHLSLFAPNGTAIELQDSEALKIASSDIRIGYNYIIALSHGIDIRCLNEKAGNNRIWIYHNQIGMVDKENGRAGIFSIADDVLIERNKIVALPPEAADDPSDEEDNDPRNPLDPCYNPEEEDNNDAYYVIIFFRMLVFILTLVDPLKRKYKTQGGIQIGDGSETVKIFDNKIIGGAGHGITLGSEAIVVDQDTENNRLHTIPVVENYISGQVLMEGQPVKNVNLLFRSKQNELTAVTNADGRYSISPAPKGEYGVTILSPDYEVVNIVSNIDATREFTRHNINLAKITSELVFAFLEEITIEKNTIQKMGNSGIGTYDMLHLGAGKTLVNVEDILINNNKIVNNAQQVPSGIPENLISHIGFGGITLSFCETARIIENNILNEGLTNLDPVSGIFIRFADKVEISGNKIINRGQKVSNFIEQPKKGNRSGIYIGMNIVSRVSEVLNDLKLSDYSDEDSMPALKLSNNIVSQFMGQALVVTAMGPVSVIGNQFTSQGVNQALNTTPDLAAAVYLFDLGVSKNFYNMLLFAKTQNTGHLREKSLVGLFPYGYFLPPGNVLFNDNQTTLDLQSQQFEWTISSQCIFTLDDISYNGNQSDCYFILDLLLINTFLGGVTVRTANNRFKESLLFAFLSLLSRGFFANTAIGNQGTHCLAVKGPHRIKEHNLEFYETHCAQFTE